MHDLENLFKFLKQILDQGSIVIIYAYLRREGGSGVKKTSLAYIKVQPVIELLLFTESQNLCL